MDGLDTLKAKYLTAVANVADRAARSLARLLDRQRDHQGISMSGVIEA